MANEDDKKPDHPFPSSDLIPGDQNLTLGDVFSGSSKDGDAYLGYLSAASAIIGVPIPETTQLTHFKEFDEWLCKIGFIRFRACFPVSGVGSACATLDYLNPGVPAVLHLEREPGSADRVGVMMRGGGVEIAPSKVHFVPAGMKFIGYDVIQNGNEKVCIADYFFHAGTKGLSAG